MDLVQLCEGVCEGVKPQEGKPPIYTIKFRSYPREFGTCVEGLKIIGNFQKTSGRTRANTSMPRQARERRVSRAPLMIRKETEEENSPLTHHRQTQWR